MIPAIPLVGRKHLNHTALTALCGPTKPMLYPHIYLFISTNSISDACSGVRAVNKMHINLASWPAANPTRHVWLNSHCRRRSVEPASYCMCVCECVCVSCVHSRLTCIIIITITVIIRSCRVNTKRPQNSATFLNATETHALAKMSSSRAADLFDSVGKV